MVPVGNMYWVAVGGKVEDGLRIIAGVDVPTLVAVGVQVGGRVRWMAGGVAVGITIATAGTEVGGGNGLKPTEGFKKMVANEQARHTIAKATTPVNISQIDGFMAEKS
jgi:hypothetical protein